MRKAPSARVPEGLNQGLERRESHQEKKNKWAGLYVIGSGKYYRNRSVHLLCPIRPARHLLSLSLCLSFFGRRWLSLACSSPSPLLAAPFSLFLTLSIPLRSCSAPLPSLIPTFVCLFCSLPNIPSLYHFPGAHIKNKKRSKPVLALLQFPTYYLLPTPAGFPTCPSFNLTIVTPPYFVFTPEFCPSVDQPLALHFLPAQHWLTFSP